MVQLAVPRASWNASRFEPIDDFVHERFDSRPSGIDPPVGFLVGRATLIVHAFELGTVRSERPALIGRKPGDDPVEGRIQPHGDTIRVDGGTIRRIDECATAGRDDEMPLWQLLEHNCTLDRPEVGLTVFGEYVGDRHVLAPLNKVVDIEGLPVEAPGQRSRKCCLARRHEAD